MKIYCSGIGGIGLSAYAALQRENGHTVLGSDRSESSIVKALRERGVEVFTTQEASHIPPDTDLFVYSEAIPKDAPEMMRATEMGIPMMSYFKALGELSRDAFVIAICGTHGKSSTTAMVAKVFVDAGLDPTVVLGTLSPDLDNRNWRKGKSEYFIVEACEYRKSFHYISPDIALMTNADGDHFDAYSSLSEYHQAFVDFLDLLPEDGVVITHRSDADCERIASQAHRATIDADAFDPPQLGVPGEHMRENARLVLALAKHLDLPDDAARSSLREFRGTWRRMEVKGAMPSGAIVVDDYAHHPKEIAATLSAMRQAYPDRRIVCVFQPHTHDRTLKLYPEFTRCFSKADVLIIPDIYVARSDIETAKVDLEKFLHDITRESGTQTINGNGLPEAEKTVRASYAKSSDVVVCMGAGSITTLATSLMTA